jgi:hypothetical protein
MALQNQTGVYCRITSVDLATNRVCFELYRDESTRNNLGEFDQIVRDSTRCATLATHLATNPGTGSVQTDVQTCGYLALKDEPPFNNAGTEVWTDC